MQQNHPLFFIVGATASGKSALSLQAALELGGHIVNADSVQVYRHVDIGTAKPSSEELKKIPHHLFDFVEPPEKMTAGKYHKLARDVVFAEVKEHPLFVVGGSGFYLQALEKGMYPVNPTDLTIEKVYQEILQNEGTERLHLHLREKDPEYANRVPPKDSYRVLRALCLIDLEKKSMAEIEQQFQQDRQKNQLPLLITKVGLYLERGELRKRIQKRVDAMIEKGLLSEVEALLKRGLKGWAPMLSVGYKETVEYIEGQLDPTTWKKAIETSTMQLAKRQMTWFRRDKEIRWFHSQKEWDKAMEHIRQQSENHLRGTL